MIPRPAQYLLRFDDLCPTIEYDCWQRCLSLIEEFGLKPILAVIPDNQDKELNLSPPDPEFWPWLRAMEAAGATIALHGYRHLCASQGESLLPLHHHTEFAGVPEVTQRRWIREGRGILLGQGLNPTIFVAPRHGFDCATLRALRMEGFPLLSDGFARVPFNRGGITWIPQQLWGPVEKSKGLWTICLHPNTASDSEIAALRAFLTMHSDQFTSVYGVLFRSQPTTLTLAERIYAEAALWRLKISRAARRSRRLMLLRSSNDS